MWGNRLGWQISAAIASAALVFWVWLNSALAITARTALSLDSGNLAELSLPAPGAAIVVRDQAGNAGDSYRAAILKYEQDSGGCDAYAKNPDGDAPEPMKLILEAARKMQMDLFTGTPGEIVDYQAQHPPLEELNEIGRAMDRAGLMFERGGKLELAREYFRAVYALGENLYRERLVYDEYLKGIGMMEESATGLSECEPAETDAQAALQRQIDAIGRFNSDHVQPIYSAISGLNESVIAANAGDVFAFATESADRMIRVEAILKLGRYRFDASRRGDQMGAERYLRRLVNDPDPICRFAAQQARDLTLEQYRMIH